MSDGPLLWYLSRATGVTLLLLLTVSVVLGVLSLGGRPGGRLPAFVSQHLHRNAALLSVVALVVHVATAVADEFVDIRWWDAFVPFGASYERTWMALGALALDLVLVVVVTSALRTRIPEPAWRRVHYLSWGAWALGVGHGVGMGTDLKDPDAWALWSALPTATCVLAVLVALGVRLGRSETVGAAS
jgi:predicted ferric reductase